MPVRRLCQLLKVSVVSYYRYLKSEAAAAAKQEEDDDSDDDDEKAVREIFWRHSRRYGSRRIHAELRAEGRSIGRHRIRRLLLKQGLRAIQPRSYVPRTTESRHSLGYSPNLLLAEELPPQCPRRIIVGDITYLPLLKGGFAYLATWMDLYSRKVLGWAVRETLEEELVTEALEMALRRSAPFSGGAIAHSDRGGQYASKALRQLLHRAGIKQSMSRAGESYDNAFAESLFSRYKAELLEEGAFPDVEEAESESFNYIEVYYNRVRRHSGLGYLSPDEYERKYQEEKQRAEAAAKAAAEDPLREVSAKQHWCIII